MKKKIILASIPLILWMSLIFFFSHQKADNSSELSEGATKKIITFVIKIVDSNAGEAKVDEIVDTFNPSIRKLAHFTEYFILGILLVNLFIKIPMSLKKIVFLSIISVMLYATSDEVHQIFIEGRSCQLKDILLDTLGGVLAILTYIKIHEKRLKITNEN